MPIYCWRSSFPFARKRRLKCWILACAAMNGVNTKSTHRMSALGQKQTFAPQNVMSALPSKADMCGAVPHVRFGPIATFFAALGVSA